MQQQQFACFIFVYDTGDTISTVSTIDTSLPFSTWISNTISTINTVSAVFTVDTNFAIFTIFTCYSDSFSFKVFIKFNVDSCVTICILTDDSFNVFAAVLSISFSAFALNFYSGTKFISFTPPELASNFKPLSINASAVFLRSVTLTAPFLVSLSSAAALILSR